MSLHYPGSDVCEETRDYDGLSIQERFTSVVKCLVSYNTIVNGNDVISFQ